MKPKSFPLIPVYLTVASWPPTTHCPSPSHRHNPPPNPLYLLLCDFSPCSGADVCKKRSLFPVLQKQWQRNTTQPLSAVTRTLFNQGGLCHTQTQPPSTPPPSLALCQAEARLMTMWISIPHTRWAELCPGVPNHQQCAFCCTRTPTTIQQDQTCCSKHTHPQKEPRRLLLWPNSRASLQSPDH